MAFLAKRWFKLYDSADSVELFLRKPPSFLSVLLWCTVTMRLSSLNGRVFSYLIFFHVYPIAIFDC